MQQTRSNAASRNLWAAQLPNIMLAMLQVTKHKQKPLHFWTLPLRNLVCLVLHISICGTLHHAYWPNSTPKSHLKLEETVEALSCCYCFLWNGVCLYVEVRAIHNSNFTRRWHFTLHAVHIWMHHLPVLYRINHKWALSVVMSGKFRICGDGTVAPTLVVTPKRCFMLTII